MITEEQILNDIRRIPMVRNFHELGLLSADISKKIDNAARIEYKAKRKLREILRGKQNSKENVLANELASQISNLCGKISRKVSTAGSELDLNLVENEVVGSFTEFSLLEKKLLGVMSPISKKLLVEIRANRDALARQISNKRYEFEREEARRRAVEERRRREKEERRRREEEERKRKEEEERRRREAERMRRERTRGGD